LCLFLQVGSESVAKRHAKCCIFGGTTDFHMRSHIFRTPSGVILDDIAVGREFSSIANP
jgi:hypothetical protein